MIFLAPKAIADIERLREFLQPNNPDAAGRALRLIWDALERVERFPEPGSATSDPRIRQVIVAFGAGAYVIRYSVDRETGAILVTRIWHGRELR